MRVSSMNVTENTVKEIAASGPTNKKEVAVESEEVVFEGLLARYFATKIEDEEKEKVIGQMITHMVEKLANSGREDGAKEDEGDDDKNVLLQKAKKELATRLVAEADKKIARNNEKIARNKEAIERNNEAIERNNREIARLKEELARRHYGGMRFFKRSQALFSFLSI